MIQKGAQELVVQPEGWSQIVAVIMTTPSCTRPPPEAHTEQIVEPKGAQIMIQKALRSLLRNLKVVANCGRNHDHPKLRKAAP